MCGQPYNPTPARGPSATGPDARGLSRKHGAAFTIVELLVVILIIVIVIGLVIGAAAKMNEGAKASRTRALLSSLRAIATEWEVVAGSHVDTDTIEGFVAATKQLPTTRKMLTALGKDVYNEGVIVDEVDGADVVIDSWGGKFQYVRSNKHGPGGRNDLPEYPLPFFASAGPDSVLGDLHTKDPNAPPQKDNLYSFDLE